ncbi:MAG: hypothetical protein C0621_08850 [Desulfuromonas sp.]|nr:MAG: hypothetical protein C0621_08850 [Desulfuromonas sp.]
MTLEIDLLMLIAILVAVVLVAALVPMLLQIKRTAARLEGVLGELEKELPETLKALRQSATTLNRTAEHAEEGMADARRLMGTLATTGDSLRQLQQMIPWDLSRSVSQLAGMWVGLRAAGRVIAQQLSKEEKGEDHGK